jgi:hypothetical protein
VSGNDHRRFATHCDSVDPMANVLANQESTKSSGHFGDKVVTFQVRSTVPHQTNLLQDCRGESVTGPTCPNNSANDPSQGRPKLLLASHCCLAIAKGGSGTKLFNLLLNLKAHDDSLLHDLYRGKQIRPNGVKQKRPPRRLHFHQHRKLLP